MKKPPKKIAKLTLSKETLDRIDLAKVAGGYGNIAKIIETDTPSECFC